jgi:hypothetical protein
MGRMDGSGLGVGGFSDTPVLSPDGRLVLFQGLGTRLVAGPTLGAGNMGTDLFVRGVDARTTRLVGVKSEGTAEDLLAVKSGFPPSVEPAGFRPVVVQSLFTHATISCLDSRIAGIFSVMDALSRNPSRTEPGLPAPSMGVPTGPVRSRRPIRWHATDHFSRFACHSRV